MAFAGFCGVLAGLMGKIGADSYGMRQTPVVFTIEGTLPPSINGLMRSHWAERHRQALKFGWTMKCAIRKEDVATLKAWRDLRLKLRIVMEVTTPKEYDQDNVYSLGKIPLDAMKQMQWITDDGPKFVHFEAYQKVGAKAVTFRIQPLEQEASR
jgi:hypothetical protein